jgi:hypothetical protein
MQDYTLQQFTYRVQPIEQLLKSGGNNTKIDDQPQLKNSIVFRIRSLNDADITKSPLTGNTVIAAADFAKASINLVQGSEQKLNNIPLPVLHDMQNATPTPFTRNPYLFNRLSISWSLSQIILINATWSQDQYAVFMVEYAYPEDFGFATVDQYFNSLQKHAAIPVQTRS